MYANVPVGPRHGQAVAAIEAAARGRGLRARKTIANLAAASGPRPRSTARTLEATPSKFAAFKPQNLVS